MKELIIIVWLILNIVFTIYQPWVLVLLLFTDWFDILHYYLDKKD